MRRHKNYHQAFEVFERPRVDCGFEGKGVEVCEGESGVYVFVVMGGIDGLG